jgi:hypothetical protein
MLKNDIPIYEQSTKNQKANKPAIEDVCDYFLTDDNLKESMADLLKYLRGIKMNPNLFSKNAYKCSYKLKKVAAISIKGKDNIIITVVLADKEDLEKVILELPEDYLAELLNRKLKHCSGCSPVVACDNGVSFEVSGKKYRACAWHTYICQNPTAGQFKMIKKFIEIRRNNIINPTK